jgi:hypothetical protein
LKLFPFALIPALALAQGIPIKSGSSTDTATVNPDKELRVNTGVDPTKAGFSRFADSLGRSTTILDDEIRSLNAAVPQVEYSNPNEGIAVDPRVLNSALTTMTLAQAASYLTLNSTPTNAVNTNARISTHRNFAFYNGQGFCATWTFRRPIAQAGQTNELVEMGVFNAVTPASGPTDGMLFRWNAVGEFRAVSVYNSIESTTLLTSPTANVVHTGLICRRSTGTDFFVDKVRLAAIEDASNASPISQRGLPFSARIVIAATSPTAAPQLLVGPQSIVRLGNVFWQSALHSPLTPYAQLSNFTNSTTPVSATLANATSGYATLGGKFQFAAPAGAVTDYALFGFQVPVGYRLNVTAVRINSCNTGAAVATTASMFEWGVSTDSTNVNLATVDSFGPPFTSMAPRRIALGQQGYVIGAAIGQCAPDIIQTFVPPISTETGRFFHVIMQSPIGTATAAQVIRGSVTVTGYFE